MKSVKNVVIKNRKIILNTELNVSLGEDGKVSDDTRLQAGAETINYVMEQEPKMLLLVGHLGRPKGVIVPELSTEILVKYLEKILNKRVIFVDKLERLQAIIQAEVFDSEAVYLLENIRFWGSEEGNSEEFGRELGGMFQVYINDNFSTSHREHASFVQVPKFIKEVVAGLLLEKEYGNLSVILNKPKKPAIAIIGGSKIATKLPVIENLAKKYDKVLVGGMVANEAIDEKIKFDKNVILPIDFSPAEKSNERLDIGPLTVAIFKTEILKAKSIVWNGPLGKFEDDEASNGTRNIVKAIEDSNAFSLIGGGETLLAIKMFGDIKNYNYISQSGGAMLEFLAGKKLPGVEAIK